MNLFYLTAVGLLIVMAATTMGTQAQYDNPPTVLQARAQVDQYRTFMFVADQYMKTYAGGAGTIPWSTLAAAPGMPSGAAGAGVPATWKVVVAADNSWVACTDIDPRSIGAIGQFATAAGLTLNATTLAGQSYVVMGAAGDTSKASQCS